VVVFIYYYRLIYRESLSDGWKEEESGKLEADEQVFLTGSGEHAWFVHSVSNVV